MGKLQTSKKRAVYFYDSYIDDECLYFVSIFHDGFFRFDLKTKQLEYLGDSGMDDANSNLNVKVRKIDQSLFSVPNFGNCLFEYDLEKKVLRRHALPIKKNEDEPLMRAFLNICKLEDRYYLIPKSYPAIVEIALSTDEIISEYGEWREGFSDIKRLWFVDEVMVGTSVYIVQAWSNRILEYDLAEHRYAVHFIGENDDEFSFIKYDGKVFWLFCRNKLKILQWDKENNSVRVVDSFSTEIRKVMEGKLEHETIDDILSNVYIDSGFIYLISSLNPVILQIDMETMHHNLVFLRDITMPEHIEWVLPFAISGIDKGKIYCMVSDGKLITYDKTWRKINDVQIDAPLDYDQVVRKHMYRALSKGKALYETDLSWAGWAFHSALREMLTWKPQKCSMETGTCGKNIYQNLFR